MDSPFSGYPNIKDQTLLLDMLNEYPSTDPFDDLSFMDPNSMHSTLSSSFSPLGDGEFSDDALKHINQVLMEEDMEPKPCMFHDPLVLQATEESLYEVIGGGKCSDSQEQNPPCLENEHVPVGSRGKKSHQIDLEDGRSAVYMDDEEGQLSDMFGKALLGKAVQSKEDQVCQKACDKKRGNKKEVIDLRRLLISCAEAVGVDDRGTATDLLKQIRLHSSPFGDCTQRLAHCFANALAARLAGTGSELYTTSYNKRVSGADISKFYRAFIAVCPFMKMTMIFANHMIIKAAEKAETLHIVDFGIRQGFQWPALIHCLSRRPGGPPKLRITGIELTLSGCRPEETVLETGHRLANYCKRFNVPFEYYAIAKKWETLQVDDLNVRRNEVLAVHCFCRMKYLLDETVMVNSPKDTVLNLIRKLNPDVFVQSVVNGSHNAPFFVPRFREALFHFSAYFDMLDTNLPREDQMRLGFENEFIGREVLNIVACEGTKRIVRPETYKQWQIRNMRAGFRQLPLDYEVVNKIRDKVKMEYHPHYVFDEDGHWMLQGWKSRMLFGSACWAPTRT